MRKAHLLFLTFAAVLTAAGGDETTARLGKAATVLNTMTQSGHDIRAENLPVPIAWWSFRGSKKAPLL